MNLFIPKTFPFAAQVSAALFHYAEKLGLNGSLFTVNLAIRDKRDKNYDAICRFDNLGEKVPEFTIVVCPSIVNNYARLFTVLAHEMVHVRQYVYKQITFKPAKASNGKSFFKEYYKGRRTDNIPYLDKPCEKQALRLQDKLFISFLDTL